MRIAVVAPSAIPSRKANTFQTMKMCQALANLGHTVHLAAPLSAVGQTEGDVSTDKRGFPGVNGIDWASLAHYYGLKAASEDGENPPSGRAASFSIERLPSDLRLRRYDFGWQAVKWAHRLQVDLLYTRLPQAAAIASRQGLPTILEIHDLPQGRAGRWLFHLFLSGSGARRLVVITRALAKDLEQKAGIPAHSSKQTAFMIIAPDGIDLARFADLPVPEAARRRLQPAIPDRFTVGYTGHLYAGRGIDLILQLAGCLPGINFLIVGGEPGDAAELSGKVKSLGLENMILCGFIPNAELPFYQAACEALLMPYQKHVAASSGGDIASYLSPMKVFEYMACGRAILSSDLAVLREVLTPDNAILLPPDHLPAWVAAIRELQADSQRRAQLAEQARHDALQYTWEARAERILDRVLLNATSGKPSHG